MTSFEDLIQRGIDRTLEQGVPCTDSQGSCRYEVDGLKCVVGHMLDAGHVAANRGGGFRYNLVARHQFEKQLGEALTVQQMETLMRLQHWHDAGMLPTDLYVALQGYPHLQEKYASHQ